MDDLISRQAAIAEIEYELEMINSALDSITLDFATRERLRQRKGEAREILNSIQMLPSAQPERKKGTWLTVENPNYSPFDCSSEKISVCSVCGYAREQHDFNYCPNCGAAMEGGEDDEAN